MTTFPRQQNLVVFIQYLFGKCHRLQSQRSSFVQVLPYRPVCYILVSHNAVQFEDVRCCHGVMSRSANSRTGIGPFLGQLDLLPCHCVPGWC